jgi:uncharacterized membrane protein HdeD (DUF308 family)
MTASSVEKAADLFTRLWWLSLLRGFAALLLGASLLVAPTRGRPMLATYMGMYWLSSGALSILWGLRGARYTRLWLLAGIIGALSGVVIVSHRFFAPPLDPAIFVYAFATVAILTGVMHILGGYQIQQQSGRRWSRGSFFLGLFEILLGVLLLISSQEVSPGVIIAAIAWSLVGGIGLIADALRLRKMLVEKELNDNTLE